MQVRAKVRVAQNAARRVTCTATACLINTHAHSYVYKELHVCVTTQGTQCHRHEKLAFPRREHFARVAYAHPPTPLDSEAHAAECCPPAHLPTSASMG